MKIIIVGCGKMGKYLSTILSKEKYNVTAIDIKESVISIINDNNDVTTICGNGLIVDTLLEADVKHTDLLISTMKNDEDNMLCCLLAKKLGVKSTISRIRNPEYTDSVIYIKEELGLSMSINPELLTAKEITSILKFQDNVKSSYFAKGKIELVTFKVKENSKLENISLKYLDDIFKSKVLIIGVERDNKVCVPNGEFIFQKNDKVIITSTPKNILNFFKKLGTNYLNVKDVMIVGGSKVSYYLSKFLHDINIDVKIIETDKDKCDLLSEKLNDTLIINGDGSDKKLLIEEGINNVDVFVAATGIDEENVVFSMFANSINVPKVITKINHFDFVEVLDTVGIESIVTPHVIASNHILRYIRARENSRGGSMESLIRLMDNKIEIMEFIINKDFKGIGKSLKNIKFKKNLIVVCINRKGKIIFPTGDDIIEENDSIIISSIKLGIKGLNDILG